MRINYKPSTTKNKVNWMNPLASYVIASVLIVLSSSAFAEKIVQYENILFSQREIPFYQFADYTPQAALHMDYADFEMFDEDMENWLMKSPKVVPYEIDLVFTKYPSDTAEWRTKYHKLLDNRMKKLFHLDSTLQYFENVKWNMYLQTQCETEDQAKRYFHGFVIKYKPKRIRVIESVKTPKDLKALVTGFARTRDTTVMSVLNRHPEWKDMLVVMDWTGSMYKYGAQLVLWHKLKAANHSSPVGNFVFFNDGNKRKTLQKKIGKTGGIYHSRTNTLEEIVKMMVFVMEKGNGGDAPENDVEALLTSIRHLETYGDVVLICDNSSSVRDIELAKEIPVPVRIILCGTKKDGDIHPDYLRLASETGGSIHTVERDITNLEPSSKLED